MPREAHAICAAANDALRQWQTGRFAPSALVVATSADILALNITLRAGGLMARLADIATAARYRNVEDRPGGLPADAAAEFEWFVRSNLVHDFIVDLNADPG